MRSSEHAAAAFEGADGVADEDDLLRPNTMLGEVGLRRWRTLTRLLLSRVGSNNLAQQPSVTSGWAKNSHVEVGASILEEKVYFRNFRESLIFIPKL